jgi:hypothetical protein
MDDFGLAGESIADRYEHSSMQREVSLSAPVVGAFRPGADRQ